MNQKIKIAVVYGGPSNEHKVSLRSAKSIVEALQDDKYEVIPVGITKDMRWIHNSKEHFLENIEDINNLRINEHGEEVVLLRKLGKKGLFSLNNLELIVELDLAFPIIHGNFGEDGILQGILEGVGIPYIGPDVLGSSLCMDKDAAKKMLTSQGIPVAKGICLHQNEESDISFEEIRAELGLPLFVKPCHAGSSVGVSKAKCKESFYAALEKAFQYDKKILIEEAIVGREIECAVLGNANPNASVLGEIITQDFYSFEAKYINDTEAQLIIPALVDNDTESKIQKAAIQTFKALCCEGIARVDFFLKQDNQFVVNEVNTLPGFTSISMYPKLWEASGLAMPELLDKMVSLAIERHEEKQKLKID
jgi:D-alanine-D-alanine ligase